MNYNISKIIERDSKTTTYKFALLRGVIDIIQDNSPYISLKENKVNFPTGLLIEKWILYYYPILESQTAIPQINGETNLAFGSSFGNIISAYKEIGGFSVFYNDLRNKGIPKNLQNDFFELAKKIRDTITRMPMKYIGRSISNDYYSIFNFENGVLRKGNADIDIQFLIQNFGTFSIPKEYYEAFKILGSFINGQDSILFKWAEFSVNASKQNLSISKVVNEVLKSPITEREISESKRIYKEILKREGQVYCVWTGKKIASYDIDHLIPFSIWKNNDLWNLLPSDSKTNNQKRDKIPSPELIEKQKNLIVDYWEILNESQSQRFNKEIQIALYRYSRLHLKAYLDEYKNCFLTSANISSRALNLPQCSNYNYEIGTIVENLDIDDRLYFSIIESDSVLITDSIYKQLSEQLVEKKKEFPDEEEFSLKFEAPDKDFLISALPMTYSVETLYRIYEDKEFVSETELNCVLHDLAIYKIPLGLTSTEFRQRLSEAFFSHKFVKSFLENLELTDEIYFGLAKDWIHRNCADVPTPRKWEITENIQILYRWIVKLGNGKYNIDRPNHSERLRIV